MTYCILFYHVCLLSFGVLLFSEGKRSRSKSGGEERLEGAARSGTRGNCGQSVLCESKIYFQIKIKKKKNHKAIKTNSNISHLINE